MNKIPLSVVVITKNEEANIVQCLKSVHNWADEIVVVDDESSDKTVLLAQQYADKTFHRKMDNEGKHRNWSYAQAKNNWILSLDADEVLTDELKEEISGLIPGTEYDMFTIPRRNYLGDYWVKHGGQYPAAQLRLFKKGSVRYEEVAVHPRVFWEGTFRPLSNDMVHYSYKNFEHFLSKQNKQTTLEAQKWIETNRQMSLGRAIWRTVDRFIRSFFVKKGFRDGFIGFMFSFFASLYQIISYAKYWEMKKQKNNETLNIFASENAVSGSKGKIPLSVVVITKNEENNIGECLKSAYRWADEIIVVDDESADNTVSVAEQYADKIFHRKMDNEGKHRNWAYAQAKNEWVLSLDADEAVSEELREEIPQAIQKNSYEAFAIPIRTYIGDYWVKHSGWYPANKVRMFMKSRQRYEEAEVHPKLVNMVKTGNLEKDIIHKGYPTFEHFLASLNRQTTLEAKKWTRTRRNMSLGQTIWRTIDRFPRSFIGKKGYKDGFIGFMIAFFASLYQIMSYAKYWEMKKTK